MMKYLVVIEKTEYGYSAYSPDLPGCVAAGSTKEEVEQLIQESITFHVDGLKEEGEEVPPPSAYSTYLDVEAA